MGIAKSLITAVHLKPGFGTLTAVRPDRQKPNSTGTSLSGKSSSTGDNTQNFAWLELRPNFVPCSASFVTFAALGYSALKLFTGLAIAVLMACQLTVSKVSAIAPPPASAKIHQDNVA